MVEVSLKELMTGSNTQKKMLLRTDDFTSLDGKPVPGKLTWEVGYFPKVDFEEHLAEKKENAKKIKQKIIEAADAKLREAKGRDEQHEIEQQRKEDLEEAGEETIAGSPPSDQWPSGILRVWIEQIKGLEAEKIRDSHVSEVCSSSKKLRVLNFGDEISVLPGCR